MVRTLGQSRHSNHPVLWFSICVDVGFCGKNEQLEGEKNPTLIFYITNTEENFKTI
jgi:hypothetical protein